MFKQLEPDQEQMTVCLLHSIYGDLVCGKIRWYLFERPRLIEQRRKEWTKGLGHSLIKEVRIEIGGVEIDRHYGEWLEIWSKMSQNED